MAILLGTCTQDDDQPTDLQSVFVTDRNTPPGSACIAGDPLGRPFKAGRPLIGACSNTKHTDHVPTLTPFLSTLMTRIRSSEHGEYHLHIFHREPEPDIVRSHFTSFMRHPSARVPESFKGLITTSGTFFTCENPRTTPPGFEYVRLGEKRVAWALPPPWTRDMGEQKNGGVLLSLTDLQDDTASVIKIKSLTREIAIAARNITFRSDARRYRRQRRVKFLDDLLERTEKAPTAKGGQRASKSGMAFHKPAANERMASARANRRLARPIYRTRRSTSCKRISTPPQGHVKPSRSGLRKHSKSFGVHLLKVQFLNNFICKRECDCTPWKLTDRTADAISTSKQKYPAAPPAIPLEAFRQRQRLGLIMVMLVPRPSSSQEKLAAAPLLTCAHSHVTHTWVHRKGFRYHADRLRQMQWRDIETFSRHDGNTARLAHRSDEALEVRVSFARNTPSLLDPECAARFSGVPVKGAAYLAEETRCSVFEIRRHRLKSHRYTQHDGNTASQFNALRVRAKLHQARVSLSPLSFPRLQTQSIERRRNVKTAETGDPREKPPSRGIVRHDSHVRKKIPSSPWLERSGEIWAEQMRVIEVSMELRRNEGAG
ncbi:hypothetical protein PR048_025988 [Dryococelus australis]|uniref:Uncharacterized protein n=1 Tax=Dryococelus australis TaxID=614101 RepID=A0ABQ9GK50_9NEOP|nr:hypothetical protein PR048_025988 [Dryococelus australis]